MDWTLFIEQKTFLIDYNGTPSSHSYQFFPFHIVRKFIDRVFEDSEADAKNSKSYEFWKESKLEITGHVEEYEPETILLSVNSRKLKKEQFDFIIMKSEYDSRSFPREEYYG